MNKANGLYFEKWVCKIRDVCGFVPLSEGGLAGENLVPCQKASSGP